MVIPDMHFEIMLNNLAIANLTRDSKIHQIHNIMQTNFIQEWC